MHLKTHEVSGNRGKIDAIMLSRIMGWVEYVANSNQEFFCKPFLETNFGRKTGDLSARFWSIGRVLQWRKDLNEDF